MPRRAITPPLTANQARYVLEKLIDERKVSPDDVRRHIAAMWEEMSFIEKRIADLRGAVEIVKHPVHEVKEVVKRAKKRRKASPEVTAKRKLQGQYVGYVKQIPEGDRKRFSEIAKSKGLEAAISAMKKRLGK